MRSLFSKLLLLCAFTICLTSCDPDDLDRAHIPSDGVYAEDCCGEQGQLPSEPGEDEEEEDTQN